MPASEGVLRKIISDKNVMLSIFSQPEAAQKLQENTCTGVSFLKKVADCSFIKDKRSFLSKIFLGKIIRCSSLRL